MARRYTADEVGGVMDDLSDMSIDEGDLSELEDTDIELSDDSDEYDSTSTNSSDWRTWDPSDSDFCNIRNKSSRLGRPSGADAEERLNGKSHFIAKAAHGHNKNCMVCNTRAVRKTTVFYCETCQRKPGLHPGKCFKKYQTLKDYK